MIGLRGMRILIGPILIRLTCGSNVMIWGRMRILSGLILTNGSRGWDMTDLRGMRILVGLILKGEGNCS